jgi:hypothetical protein
MHMPPNNTEPDGDRLDLIVAKTRRNQEPSEKAYREQALKIYPWPASYFRASFVSSG